MNPAHRLQSIKDIALYLQAEHTTNEINIMLAGYKIPTKNVNIVDSKRLYVIELLKNQPNEIIRKIANDLELTTPEKTVNKEEEKLKINGGKIFISHSNLDSLIVAKVIDLLEAMQVPSNKIFCSSFEGYSIELGKNFLDAIKKEIDNNAFVLFILTSNFYKSPLCLCEMGACWMKTNEHVPILIPPFNFSNMEGVFSTSQAMKVDEKFKWNSLKNKVNNFLDLSAPDDSIWERKRDDILRQIKELTNKLN